MESSKACRQAIYAIFSSDESTEDSNKLVKNEVLASYPIPDN